MGWTKPSNAGLEFIKNLKKSTWKLLFQGRYNSVSSKKFHFPKKLKGIRLKKNLSLQKIFGSCETLSRNSPDFTELITLQKQRDYTKILPHAHVGV